VKCVVRYVPGCRSDKVKMVLLILITIKLNIKLKNIGKVHIQWTRHWNFKKLYSTLFKNKDYHITLVIQFQKLLIIKSNYFKLN